MKKILVYMNSMAPAGGIERVVSNLFNKLSKDVEVVLLTKDAKESFYKLNNKITVYSLNNYLELDLKKSKISRIVSILKNIFIGNIKLRAKLKKINPDYIYVVSPLEAMEILFAKYKHQKLLISEHGSKFGYNKIYNYIKKIIYPKAYKLVVPSTMDTDLYLKEGFKAIYIPHLNTFENNKKNDLKEKIVLNIGRYTDDKQQDLLIDIWSELYKTKNIKEWKLYIVGSGENEKKLQKKIEKYNLGHVIKLLPPKKNVNEYFEKASIFAFTSRYEGFGMVLLEAMSFGIPCISFDCPSGPRDIIENKINGYLIPENDIKMYVDKLNSLISNKDEIVMMGDKAFSKAINWNKKDMINSWKELLGVEK